MGHTLRGRAVKHALVPSIYIPQHLTRRQTGRSAAWFEQCSAPAHAARSAGRGRRTAQGSRPRACRRVCETPRPRAQAAPGSWASAGATFHGLTEAVGEVMSDQNLDGPDFAWDESGGCVRVCQNSNGGRIRPRCRVLRFPCCCGCRAQGCAARRQRCVGAPRGRSCRWESVQREQYDTSGHCRASRRATCEDHSPHRARCFHSWMSARKVGMGLPERARTRTKPRRRCPPMSNEYALRRWFTIETSLAEERARERTRCRSCAVAARRPSAVGASGRPLQT